LPGQTVLDCCCGLGSTLVAAELLGRNWIGCDLSRTYCQVAMKRLRPAKAGWPFDSQHGPRTHPGRNAGGRLRRSADIAPARKEAWPLGRPAASSLSFCAGEF